MYTANTSGQKPQMAFLPSLPQETLAKHPECEIYGQDIISDSHSLKMAHSDLQVHCLSVRKKLMVAWWGFLLLKKKFKDKDGYTILIAGDEKSPAFTLANNLFAFLQRNEFSAIKE